MQAVLLGVAPVGLGQNILSLLPQAVLDEGRVESMQACLEGYSRSLAAGDPSPKKAGEARFPLLKVCFPSLRSVDHATTAEGGQEVVLLVLTKEDSGSKVLQGSAMLIAGRPYPIHVIWKIPPTWSGPRPALPPPEAGTTPWSLDQMMLGVKAAWAALKDLPGVTGVTARDVRWKGGKMIPAQCIVVFVQAKGYCIEGSPLIPAAIRIGDLELPTDVEENCFGPLMLRPTYPTQRLNDPLTMGCCIGHSTASTLGGFAVSTTAGELGFICTLHGVTGSHLHPLDAPKGEGNPGSGTHLRDLLIHNPEDDFALVGLAPGTKIDLGFCPREPGLWEAMGSSRPSEIDFESVEDPSPGAEVFKVGGTTWCTLGTIDRYPTNAKVEYPGHSSMEKVTKMLTGLFTVQGDDFAREGDSGSFIWSNGGGPHRAIGLLVGETDSHVAFAYPMRYVLGRLGVRLARPSDLAPPVV